MCASILLPYGLAALDPAWCNADFDIQGSIEAVFPIVDDLLVDQQLGLAGKLHQAKRLFTLPSRRHSHPGGYGPQLRGSAHSIERDRQAVSYHYDQSNEFFAQFLDRRMVYSCAYFVSPDEGIETAQTRKLDYICRKLRLKPGEQLLDIGCGWGGLILHAAQQYGVDATGITLSARQAELANERIRQAGLANRCRVELRDYREVEGTEVYDKLVSVGMFEHVGAAQLPTYFRQAWRLLRPGGVFLNHGICQATEQARHRGRSFIAKYVWPDGELETISTTLHAAEQTGFEVRDVESLREHYALTLHEWVRRLEAHCEQARAATDDVTYRIWRLYMAGSAYSFTKGNISIYQEGIS
ncbi:MAG: cyclopropane-fatty-acyl-phospholipid synthase family protein [Chloroflexi bacterium]|nr:cyclopropane-fatty-acyl-phospholipid synthase family protein [Chloroflexota bacterium]